MTESVVITGIGIVSAIGIGKKAFWSQLVKGSEGVRVISLFDTSRSKCKKGAEVRQFKAEDFFSRKGLICLSRTAEMICAAANLALADSELDLTAIDSYEVGVVIGTAHGNIQSMIQFSQDLYAEGPRFVNPMLFPNTVINAPAGYVSILLGNMGMNVTISSGCSSGLEAITYAVAALQRGEAEIIFAGGGDEISPFTYLGLQHAGLLSGSQGDGPEESAPFDRRRNGFFLGEGAAVLVLERRDHALARQAPILAEMAGWGNCFIPNGLTADDPKVALQAKAMSQALRSARLNPEDIGFIAASANGSVSADRIEAKSLRMVFRDQIEKIPLSAFKSMLGESFGASGAAMLAGAILSMQNRTAPPTLGFQAGDADTGLRGIRAGACALEARAALVNSLSHPNHGSTVIIKMG